MIFSQTVSNFSLLCFAFPPELPAPRSQSPPALCLHNWDKFHTRTAAPSPALPCPEEFVSPWPGQGYKSILAKGSQPRRGHAAAHMEAAACCLPPRCLPVARDGARPAPGLEQRGRYLGCCLPGSGRVGSGWVWVKAALLLARLGTPALGVRSQRGHCDQAAVLTQAPASLETVAAPRGAGGDRAAEGTDGHCECWAPCWGSPFPRKKAEKQPDGPALLHPYVPSP